MPSPHPSPQHGCTGGGAFIPSRDHTKLGYAEVAEARSREVTGSPCQGFVFSTSHVPTKRVCLGRLLSLATFAAGWSDEVKMHREAKASLFSLALRFADVPGCCARPQK